jgi:predicted dehydrogenase
LVLLSWNAVRCRILPFHRFYQNEIYISFLKDSKLVEASLQYRNNITFINKIEYYYYFKINATAALLGINAMSQLRVGLIGTGFMGKAHALALRAAPAVFDLPAEPVCELLADVTAEKAASKSKEFCFNRWTDDWRALVADADVDVVDICTPNYLHYEMSLAAIESGKHIYCEKPLALTLEQSEHMTRLAGEAGVKTIVGFNYAKNPANALAAEMIANGELGEIVHFRGCHVEDYMANPAEPWSWRVQRETAGLGALGDLCHIVSMAQLLVGDIEELCADMGVVIPRRPFSDGSGEGLVENEDQAHMLVRFANGAMGTIECSRVAWGRKNGLSYEITGTLGTLLFDQESPNELHYYSSSDPSDRAGFRRILIGPEHPDYGAFCCAPGHGLGFNDQKIIEVRDLVEGIVLHKPIWPDFAAACEVDRVNEAARVSAEQRRWVRVGEFGSAKNDR